MSWICPKCERELPKPEQRHYCARVSLDSLFLDRPPELVLVFDKLLAEVADLGRRARWHYPELYCLYPTADLPGDPAVKKGAGPEVLFQRGAPGKTRSQKHSLGQ